MANPTDFAKMVPGFDFLQGLMKGAGAALPDMGQWVAPTLSPEEIEKRIKELRTVQFWLEQNARLLAATIQALEVQRMTLSTLKTMNLSVGDLAQAFTLKAAQPAAAATPGPAAPAAGVVDPLQWWNALTQQFSELAASALKEGPVDAAMNLAQSAVKQSVDIAGKTLKKATTAPAEAMARVRKPAAKPALKRAPPARRSR